MSLEFPPRKDNIRFDDWVLQLWKLVTKTPDAVVQTNHAQLANLNSQSYTHLTANQATDLTDGGNSGLHYHATDRDRINHTGTQPASSISDFELAVHQVSGPLEAQIFGS